MASIKNNYERNSDFYIAVIYNLLQLYITKCLRKALRQISEPKLEEVDSFRHHTTRKDLMHTGRYDRRRGEIFEIMTFRSGRITKFDVSQGKRPDQLLMQRPKGRIVKLGVHNLLSNT